MPDAVARHRRYQRALLLWVIGHEIGHITFGDAPSHFSANALTTPVANSSLGYKRELRADSFFVTRMTRSNAQAIDVAQLIIDVLNAEIRRKVGEVPAGVGILFEYTNQRVVTYARRGTHPEFVVRGARVLELTGKSPDPNLRSLGAMVRPFIRHMREAPD